MSIANIRDDDLRHGQLIQIIIPRHVAIPRFLASVVFLITLSLTTYAQVEERLSFESVVSLPEGGAESVVVPGIIGRVVLVTDRVSRGESMTVTLREGDIGIPVADTVTVNFIAAGNVTVTDNRKGGSRLAVEVESELTPTFGRDDVEVSPVRGVSLVYDRNISLRLIATDVPVTVSLAAPAMLADTGTIITATHFPSRLTDLAGRHLLTVEDDLNPDLPSADAIRDGGTSVGNGPAGNSSGQIVPREMGLIPATGTDTSTITTAMRFPDTSIDSDARFAFTVANEPDSTIARLTDNDPLVANLPGVPTDTGKLDSNLCINVTTADQRVLDSVDNRRSRIDSPGQAMEKTYGEIKTLPSANS
jgi:hypothetical protein